MPVRSREQVGPLQVLELIERFERYLDKYKRPDYKEARVRAEFIVPFLESLGWDVRNVQGHGEHDKDVIHEDAIRVGGNALEMTGLSATEKPHGLRRGRAVVCLGQGGLTLPAVTAPAASAPAASVVPLRACFIYLQRPPVHLPAVELVDGLLGCGLLCHLDECKASGPTRHTICDEAHRKNLPDRSEEFRQGSFGGLVA